MFLFPLLSLHWPLVHSEVWCLAFMCLHPVFLVLFCCCCCFSCIWYLILEDCGQKTYLKQFQFFYNLPWLDSWQEVIYPGESSMCTWEKVKSAVCGWNALWIPIRSNWSNVSIRVCVSLLIFYLGEPSIDVSEVLKSPNIIVLLSISPLIVVSICLMYWVHIYFYFIYMHSYAECIYIFNCHNSWIDPVIIM